MTRGQRAILRNASPRALERLAAWWGFGVERSSCDRLVERAVDLMWHVVAEGLREIVSLM
jgi:hypothetical protein